MGAGTRIWHQAQVREGVYLGEECILSKGVYVDRDVQIGRRVKLQNYVSVYHGVTVEDGVFLGPYVCLTNDRFPRAVTPMGQLKSDADWELGQTVVREGASLGARSVILPGVEVGRWAMVGAGAVVTRSVPPYGLALGNPARLVGLVCPCGRRAQLAPPRPGAAEVTLACAACGTTFSVEAQVVRQLLEEIG